EKHFTFDKNYPEGTDHVLSATPEEFKEMVERIRNVEIMLGDGIKQPSSEERKIVNFVRGRFRKTAYNN
ncbi:MAG: N-acetylneuraminate synthase family protein, partial [Candidatus Omnitrophica bacterium]|nr:N-acetylneuraminate synthase family protein [Candidatus Omnitrophota bacterium]